MYIQYFMTKYCMYSTSVQNTRISNNIHIRMLKIRLFLMSVQTYFNQLKPIHPSFL